MVTIVVILSRINVPAPKARTIYTVVLLISDQGLPVILGDKGAILFHPCLILDLGRGSNVSRSRQSLILDRCMAIEESRVVKTPKSSELSKDRKSLVNKVLIRSSKLRLDNPVKISFGSFKGDIQEVFGLFMDRYSSPIQI